ncbi:sigma-54-dependent transcriptional regulator [Colwellia psychrerythraea]|uniref:Two component, sigma54 specific, transcriptional regulator, Fis family n=1 Tax=Colwellia psychrerythraea TaxID=28229 RepID=A0A099K704_COLPS|nr:sigma-54 dependent transcriptional regulator [Colwellia psychrerythraea]KGJ86564.1 two component, sigma54 specific, transcriptional regulator, Fis family [Colwellia psychrerythraea]
MDNNNSASPLPTLLLVDDDGNILQALKRALHNIEANIVDFQSPIAALEYCQTNQPDVVISDQHMPDMNGCELLEKIKQRWPKSQRIILSAYQDFDLVSAAFSSGVVEKYICKPWVNKELKFVVDKALSRKVNVTVIPSDEDNTPLTGLINFHGIVAEDETMHELFDSIRHASSTNAPIFITGETGTGKELVAKACHSESYHKDQPFIAVNCANFTENLIESQLFGHKKGAFTGAVSSQEGLFSAAKQGSLFLDEITTLSKPLQAKLLRVVQEREFSPLGTNEVLKFHAQIISASSNSISTAVIEGEFREDLYYRLNVITMALPPLRERGGDLVHLASFFLKKYSRVEKKHFRKFSRNAIQIICAYDWPGNIRQLENVIHGLVILNSGEQITSEMIIKSLSTTVRNYAAIQPTSALSVQPVVEKINSHNNTMNSTIKNSSEIQPLWLVEKEAIEAAILHCQGNIPKAAAMLEVSPSTIYRKKLDW